MNFLLSNIDFSFSLTDLKKYNVVNNHLSEFTDKNLRVLS
jgi:hypothetical protein